MQINCGIVGLPNVGKSTIFSALSSVKAEIGNYPFCTIEPNIGIVNVPDERLFKIADIIKPEKITPAIMEFVDIAGLVKGASKGEGLGNQFLGQIRQMAAIVQVIRCFDDENVSHINNSIDPVRDLEIIATELALADLSTVLKRKELVERQKKSQDKKVADQFKFLEQVLIKIEKTLEEAKPVYSLNLDEKEKEAIFDLHLLTNKKQFYCCNVDENSIKNENDYVKNVRKFLGQDVEIIVISGKLEAEIALLDTKEEKEEFLKDLGLEESGLDKLIKTAYTALNLSTFFTAGKKEVRAWTYKNNSTAKESAGVIHTDFSKGFIKAEVYHCNDLFNFGSEQKIKESGLLRIEGKEYIVKDGDIMFFRFNV